jgi:hypothetical protein
MRALVSAGCSCGALVFGSKMMYIYIVSGMRVLVIVD